MNRKREARTGGREDQRARSAEAHPGLGRNLNHDRVIGLYLAGCVALAALAAALLLSNCGGSKSDGSAARNESSTSPASAESTLPASSSGDAAASVPAVVTGDASASNAGTSSTPAATIAGETLPPEIAIAEMDTLVTPGQPVSFTVYGTPDVTEIALWDGVGDRQPLVHDANGDVWRVDYRVPLRPKQERLGFSLTAKNGSNRWRRVWVFLRVTDPQSAGCDADTSEAR